MSESKLDPNREMWFEACVPATLAMALDKIVTTYLGKSEAERPYYIMGLKQGGFIS